MSSLSLQEAQQLAVRGTLLSIEDSGEILAVGGHFATHPYLHPRDRAVASTIRTPPRPDYKPSLISYRVR
jgi:hypothetical protein